MELSIEIKPLKRRDLRELLLIAKVYYPTDGWLSLTWLEALEKRAVVGLTARWDTRIIGGLIATADKFPNIWLDFMAVDRNVARRGIGERLFTNLERELTAGSRLWLLVPDNKAFKPSAKFAEKMRMDAAGSLKKWFNGNAGALAFSKKIR